MPEQRVVNTSQSSDLVTQKILINGNELSGAYSIMNILVEKELNRIPKARLILLDGDPAVRDFRLSNEDLFVPGNEIEIKAGYHSDEETIFKGIVIKHSLKVKRSQAYMVVECMDEAVKLTIGRKSKYFYDSKDSDILEEIIDGYGIDKDIEATSVQHKKMVQYMVSDWDFCVMRSQANGKVLVVDDGKISVSAPDVESEEVETVSYGVSILEFNAEIDARTQFNRVTSSAWNYSDQEMVEIEGNDPGMSLNGNLSVDDLSEVISHDNLELKNGGSLVEDELQQWADAKNIFNQLARVRGVVKFQGIPSVKPNTTLNIQGVGDRFNGKVYVSAVRHQISEGNWTADVQFGMDQKWFSETTDVNELPASGLLAAVNGLQVGIVSQLEDDPDGEDRILVRLPVIDSSGEGIWSRVATLDAGDDRGSFFRPEIGDEVIVGFVNADPNEAIVLGMMNSSSKPAPIRATDENHEKGFVTRSGMKILFNDEDKSIVCSTPDGRIIEIDDNSGKIKLEDSNSNSVTLDSDGITMASEGDITIRTSGDITMEGNNVSVQANMNYTVDASGAAELASAATTVVRGSIVQIN